MNPEGSLPAGDYWFVYGATADQTLNMTLHGATQVGEPIELSFDFQAIERGDAKTLATASTLGRWNGGALTTGGNISLDADAWSYMLVDTQSAVMQGNPWKLTDCNGTPVDLYERTEWGMVLGGFSVSTFNHNAYRHDGLVACSGQWTLSWTPAVGSTFEAWALSVDLSSLLDT